MGIIISSFVGCGKNYFKNVYGDKAKINDVTIDFADVPSNEYVDNVMSEIDNYDIIFVTTNKDIRDEFGKRNIDYDVFYPSKERRQEFILNKVETRTPFKEINEIDKNFDKWIDEIENDESPNCYKHKLSSQGEFLSNSPILMQYVEGLNSRTQNADINNQENNEEA